MIPHLLTARDQLYNYSRSIYFTMIHYYGCHSDKFWIRETQLSWCCWVLLETESCAQMDAGYKELEHRWEEQQLHIREQAQQIQDTEYLGLLGSNKNARVCVSLCVCSYRSWQKNQCVPCPYVHRMDIVWYSMIWSFDRLIWHDLACEEHEDHWQILTHCKHGVRRLRTPATLIIVSMILPCQMSNESNGLRKRIQEMQQRWEVEAQEAHRQRLGFKWNFTDSTLAAQGRNQAKAFTTHKQSQAITSILKFSTVLHKFHLSWFLEGIWLPAAFQLNSFAFVGKAVVDPFASFGPMPWPMWPWSKLTLRAQQLQEEMAFLRQGSQRTEAHRGCTLLQTPA